MAIYEHVTTFAGKPVVEWDPEKGIPDPTGTIYRIGLSWEEAEDDKSWPDLFSRFLAAPGADQVTGLVVGSWGGDSGESSEPVVEALAVARDRLSRLTALFLGDIISEENEISWITQSDVAPLLAAYPLLEQFRVRGGSGLSLGQPRHEKLRELVIESGGLDREVLHEVFSGELPTLEHLEFWLGDEGYGANSTVEDLGPILSGTLFPKLRYLGLRNSEYTDEIAGVLAHAPVLGMLEVLDLSLGTLTDDGAAALLAAPEIRRLKRLDLHHHFCSPEMVEQLKALGINVDTSDPQEADEWDGQEHRYVAVSE